MKKGFYLFLLFMSLKAFSADSISKYDPKFFRSDEPNKNDKWRRFYYCVPEQSERFVFSLQNNDEAYGAFNSLLLRAEGDNTQLSRRGLQGKYRSEDIENFFFVQTAKKEEGGPSRGMTKIHPEAQVSYDLHPARKVAFVFLGRGTVTMTIRGINGATLLQVTMSMRHYNEVRPVLSTIASNKKFAYINLSILGEMAKTSKAHRKPVVAYINESEINLPEEPVMVAQTVGAASFGLEGDESQAQESSGPLYPQAVAQPQYRVACSYPANPTTGAARAVAVPPPASQGDGLNL